MGVPTELCPFFQVDFIHFCNSLSHFVNTEIQISETLFCCCFYCFCCLTTKTCTTTALVARYIQPSSIRNRQNPAASNNFHVENWRTRDLHVSSLGHHKEAFKLWNI
eukprot:TRINITY_DN15345_c0_g1_i1.p1 TRINITY_DN15345_c0_g1~~TRINITY_DN15345_c0_g1_i1.p1  ORF type:complete len:107 (+),score=5.95 TRINITY_DN15345_c0_g1_i1:369-689(+)